MNKNSNEKSSVKLFIIIVVLLCLFIFGIRFLTTFITINPNYESNIYNTEDVEEADILGSYGYINQSTTKSENWQKIVQDSPFQIGELTKVYQDSKPMYSFGTYPHIDGSTVALAMVYEFAWQHLDLSEKEAEEFVMLSTTHSAYMHLIYRSSVYPGSYKGSSLSQIEPVNLVIATAPSQEELDLATEQGVELIIAPVCYDAFVFITHKDNPVDSLTIEQVQKIYTGEITNWSEVGGNDEAIVAYQREENSGSQTGMENLVMQGLEMAEPKKITVIQGMSGLIEAVAEYQNSGSSIGYTYKYYIDTLYKNENIKILEINGISSDSENLQNQSYPFTTNYYGVIRADDKPTAAGLFLGWMLSEEGQACIKQAGYTPLIDYDK